MINENLKIGFNYEIIKTNNHLLSEKMMISLHDVKYPTKQSASEIAKFLSNPENRKKVNANVKRYHNLVPNIALREFAKRVANVDVSTYTFVANKVAVGDDGTLVTPDDIAMGNEVIRSDWTQRTNDNNIVVLDKYFGSVEVSGKTFLEAGILIDAVAGLGGDGLLLSRVNINETFTQNENMTINATITFANA